MVSISTMSQEFDESPRDYGSDQLNDEDSAANEVVSSLLEDVLAQLVQSQRSKRQEFETSLKKVFKDADTEAEVVESESDAVNEELEEDVTVQTRSCAEGSGTLASAGCEVDSDYISEPEEDHKHASVDQKDKSCEEESGEESGAGEEVKLEVGLQFHSQEDAIKMVKRFEAQTRTSFSKRSSSKNQLIYDCSHGPKRPSTSRGARPVTKTKKLGCGARICFYTRKPKGACKEGVTTLTSLDLNHENHSINDSIFSLDTVKIDEKASQIIKQLNEVGCSIPHMRSALRAKNYPVSAGHIRYFLSKLKDFNPEDEKQLKAFLRNVRETGGHVSVLKNKRGKIQAVQVTTAAMKKAYNGCRPDTIQIDNTFNLDESKYKCSGVLFLNPATNKGELVSVSFIVDETSESLRFVLSAFRDVSAHRPTAAIIDKDFTEMKILKELFPTTRILLCLFHVPSYFRSKILTTAAESKEKKDDLYEKFVALMNAPDDEEFEKKLKVWEVSMQGVQIRPSTEYVNLEDYFARNWLNCKDMWAKSSRKGLLIADEHTTCRLERTWRAVKDDLKRANGGRKLSTARCVIHVVTYTDSRLQGGLLAAQRKVCRIFHEDPDIAADYEEAGKFLNERGARKFKQSVDNMLRRREAMAVSEEGVTEIYMRDGEATPKVYKTTESSCCCTFFLGHRIPCRHILFFRRDNQLRLFDITLYRPFYHLERAFDIYDTDNEERDECGLDPDFEPRGGSLSPSESEGQAGALEPEQKFKQAQERANLLTHLLSCQGTPQFLRRMEELDIILQNARKGISLLSGQPSLRPSQDQPSVSEVKESQVEDHKTTESGPKSEEEGDEFGELKFEPKASMRGRPKVARCRSWKRPFNSSRKRKEVNNDTGTETEVVSLSEASDLENVGVEDPGTAKVCEAPRFRGQFGTNTVCLNDYASLAPRTMLTDNAVNLHLMLLLHQYEQFQKGPAQVLIIAQSLASTLTWRGT